ncbi:MAG: DNA polymerase III subunit beta [bacterium]
MEISSMQENFKKGLLITGRVAGKNMNLPILNNVLIKTDGGGIVLVATDLEIGVVCQVRGKVEKEGEFTVDSKLISDYISLLPNQKIEIKKEDEKLKIKCDNYKTIINGQNAEEFPLIPGVEKGSFVRVDSGEIKDALSRVVFAVSVSETRAELSGVLFGVEEDKIIFAATDSYRLAEKEIKIKNKSAQLLDGQGKKIVVPAKTVQEFLRIIALVDDGEMGATKEVDISFSDNQIMFKMGNIELISRLIEGQYPDYKQIIPTTFKTRATIDKKEFIRAVKASAIFSKAGINDVNLDFPLGKNKIVITSTSGQTGENTTEIESSVNGVDNGIVVNYKYLLDGLGNIDGDNVVIDVIDNNTPCVLRPEKEDGYLYIVMPIKQ